MYLRFVCFFLRVWNTLSVFISADEKFGGIVLLINTLGMSKDFFQECKIKRRRGEGCFPLRLNSAKRRDDGGCC